jgi:hypothetical protein
MDAATFQQELAQARQHLAAGSFRLAADQLAHLHRSWQRQPTLVSPREGQTLVQLLREVGALADLSSESLEEILDHAAGVPEAEWLAEFSHRYQGKAILFDLEVRSVGNNHFDHPYHLWARGQPAALDLDDLRLLATLPLQTPRTLFLARLASVRREAQRGWVIRLQADSGVLLTDAGAARICSPALAGPDVDALLKRQRAAVLAWGAAEQN